MANCFAITELRIYQTILKTQTNCNDSYNSYNSNSYFKLIKICELKNISLKSILNTQKFILIIQLSYSKLNIVYI